jgi:hypothetical protein
MTKKFFTTALCLFFTMSIFAYSGGNGTEESPYLISSVPDMEELANTVNSGTNYSGDYFLLTQDLAGITSIIGDGSHPFSGIFDGDWHTLNVSISTKNQYAGVFGYADGATIKNLGVEGSVTRVDAQTGAYAGGICGSAGNAFISDCYNVAAIMAPDKSSYVGGICGNGGTVNNCWNMGMISGSYVGGICGTGRGVISNCYNTGTIFGNSIYESSFAGGICGTGSGVISNCYNTGTISAYSPYSYPSSAGGIYGTGSGVISNCYSTGTISASAASSYSYSGGICGYSYGYGDLNISNCIAANTSLSAVGNIGRIMGYVHNNRMELENNHALTEMLVNGGTVTSQNAAEKDGKDMDISSFQSHTWIENTLNWDFSDSWYMPGGSGAFPILKSNPAIRLILSSNIVRYGDSVTFSASSDNAITPMQYSSSDNNIAEVGIGNIIIKKAGTVTISAFQAGSGPYISGTASVKLTINKAPLTISANPVSSIYGDTPQFTCRYDGFVPGETEGVLTTAPSFSCSGTAQSDAGGYTITPWGAAAQNYSFTYVNDELTIQKRDLQVTPNPTSRPYGAANPTFTFSYLGFVNGNNEASLSAKPVAATTATASSGVGPYTTTCSDGSATNYDFTYNTGTLTVTKALVTASAYDSYRYYGESDPAFSIAYSGFANSENETFLTTRPQASSTTTTTSNVGTYPIYVSGGTATNYDFDYIDGTLTISQAPVTVTAQSATSVYGDALPAFSCQYSGFMNGETEGVLWQLPSLTCSATASSDAGQYSVVPSNAAAQNYTFDYQPGTLMIQQRSLQVTPDNAARAYGDDNPAFTFSYVGLVNGNTASDIDAQPTATTVATLSSSPGEYAISCAGGSDTNYNFTYNTGKLTIIKSPLTITPAPVTRRQGEDNPPFTLSYTGFKNSETESVLDLLPTITCVADATSPIGFYDILLSGGYDNNYDYNLVNGRLEVTNPTAIGEVSATEVFIYPNPVKHTMYIPSESPIEKVEIYTQSGILALTDKAPGGKIDVSRLAAGVYFVWVYVNGGVEMRKVIVWG